MFQGSKYFRPHEFGVDGFLVKPALLRGLDAFREAVGVPVSISPAAGAVMRTAQEGQGGGSQHLQGLAADILWPRRAGVLIPPDEILAAAKLAGVTGIGFYKWRIGPGLHLDWRAGFSPERPAQWGRFYFPNGSWVDRSLAAWVSEYWSQVA